MKKIVVEKWAFDSIDNDMIDSSDLLPILQIVFKGSPDTCMEKLRYALRQGKIESEKVGKKYLPNPKSFLLWLRKECEGQ